MLGVDGFWFCSVLVAVLAAFSFLLSVSTFISLLAIYFYGWESPLLHFSLLLDFGRNYYGELQYNTIASTTVSALVPSHCFVVHLAS